MFDADNRIGSHTMLYKKPAWKENWETTQQHFIDWWDQKGAVLAVYGLPALERSRNEDKKPVNAPEDLLEFHTNAEWFAWHQRNSLGQLHYPADTLPIAHVEFGCVQLAACFGAEPLYSKDTVWYQEIMDETILDSPLKLTKNEKWWLIYKNIMLKLVEVSRGDFIIGMPGFGSNLDVLASLLGAEKLSYYLLDRPDWIKEKLEEINIAFFDAFDDYYRHIKLADGSSSFTYFHLWGPGKTSQVQCDFAAMISPDMFLEFVIPTLQRQCAWLDHSLFHLDGPNCICHLDHLLTLDELDAIQWTPGAGQPETGDPVWFDMYKRILYAGKSLQLLDVSVDQTCHIIDTFGSKGIFFYVRSTDLHEVDKLMKLVGT